MPLVEGMIRFARAIRNGKPQHAGHRGYGPLLPFQLQELAKGQEVQAAQDLTQLPRLSELLVPECDAVAKRSQYICHRRHVQDPGLMLLGDFVRALAGRLVLERQGAHSILPQPEQLPALPESFGRGVPDLVVLEDACNKGGALPLQTLANGVMIHIKEFGFHFQGHDALPYYENTACLYNYGETMQTLLLCGLAGAIGALCRLGLSRLVQHFAGTGFPYATAAVNLLGCLLFGLLWGVLHERMAVSAAMKTIIFTGFLGALTTFSTYAFENVALLAEGRVTAAAMNVVIQNATGFGLVALGLSLGRA